MSAITDQDVADLAEAVRRYDSLGWPRPEVALVSGSGLAVDLGRVAAGPIPLQDLVPFPVDGIVGHPLEVELLPTAAGHHVLYFRGRLHSYQGYSAAQTVLPIRLAARLGAATLVFTNAAGGLDPELGPGDLVLIEDQINLTGLNPLRGEPPEDWGPRFPDMVDAYDPDLRALARDKAADLNLAVSSGVYAGVAGPSYETPAEVRFLRAAGGRVTGMSTVLETIAARHMGMRVLGISLVSNPAAGVTGEALDHDEVLAASRAAAEKVKRLLAAVLEDRRVC